MKRIIVFITLAVFAGIAYSGPEKKGGSMKETALFKVDIDGKKVIDAAAVENLTLKFISVTSDQPLYWPNEDVFLKVLMPLAGGKDITVTLQKKDASPRTIGPFTLNPAGVYVSAIMSGKAKRIEAGEYTVKVRSADGKLESYTSFSVVDGALGALSFAHDFKQVTSVKDLDKEKGAWFFGNEGGVGKRWGNGLNVKNELRALNQPYSGKVKIKTRCFLSGCNGCEAGAEQTKDIKDGKLEATLDVGGHSGPFGIEVICDKGSVSYLFGRSGHVERQTIPLTGGMRKMFEATLAPYEKTTPVFGRDMFIAKKGDDGNAVFEIESPSLSLGKPLAVKLLKDMTGVRVFAFTAKADGSFAKEEIVTAQTKNGTVIAVAVSAPYTLAAIAGFVDGKYKEAWAIALPESHIEAQITASESGKPLKEFPVTVLTTDRLTKKGLAGYGILEVFDNRVQSKSAKEPLSSAVGDSARAIGDHLSSWVDRTGIIEEELNVKEDAKIAAPQSFAGAMKDEDAPSPKKMAPSRMRMSKAAPAPMGKRGETEAAVEAPGDQETIREGEKKVVYCAVVKTGADGKAVVNVTLPPQTGRCSMRFTAIDRFDHAEAVRDVDVAKDNYLEVILPELIMPGASVQARIAAYTMSDGAKILISGDAAKERTITLNRGAYEGVIEVRGEQYGTIRFSLVDKSGKTLDVREKAVRNVGVMTMTYSDVRISDGGPMMIDGEATVYANPSLMLNNIAMNMTTTMYSWFGHAESLAASAAVRAALIKAIDEGLIESGGMRDTLKSDLMKAVKDLSETFYDESVHLMRPYPGLPAQELWSVWAANNLSTMLTYLDGDRAGEFKSTVAQAKAVTDAVYAELKKRGIKTEENGYDAAKRQETIPIEVNGVVVYRAVTDVAVAEWFVKKAMPKLALDTAKNDRELGVNFVKLYDTYRFLRSFERTGLAHYLLINAKALYLARDPNFGAVFGQAAKNIVLTGEPGLIQGPALLGGVYSSPGSVVKFLDLLMAMAHDKRITGTPAVTATRNGKTETIPVKGSMSLGAGVTSITAPQFTAVRIDRRKEVNMLSYTQNKAYFRAGMSDTSLAVGDEASLTVELAKDRDPAEYYAVIAVPTTISVRQTEDLLSDYKGQLLYGQRATGGQKIMLLTVPFRGTRTLTLSVEAAIPGASEGYVFVRHMSNPDLCATVKLPRVNVK